MDDVTARRSRARSARMMALFLFTGGVMAGETAAFSPGKLSFSVKFKEDVNPYKVLAVFVLPKETLHLEVVDTLLNGGFETRAQAGKLVSASPRKWLWTAPEAAGLYPITIRHAGSSQTMTLNTFVLVPFGHIKDGNLNGYKIGKYPDVPLRDLAIYKPPRGFVEVTPEVEDVWISPHFRLKPFLCKQEQASYPKYLILRERRLLKLEFILEKTNEKGIRCDTFAILSGFRTPHYNKSIGNVKYSRHTWGGAADIFVDVNPRDGMMDDLKGDGVINYQDAQVLYQTVDSMYGKPKYDPYKGGLGLYHKSPTHGPFIHMDVRGFRARWGD